MQINAIVIALAAGICGLSVPSPAVARDNQEPSPTLLQRNTDLSAARKHDRARHRAAPAKPIYRHPGPADPSFGPDGRPYRVPEHLRGQCYIDEGYGRFSACFYR